MDELGVTLNMGANADWRNGREVVVKLSASEARREELRRRLDITWSALGSIERGEWTESGARKVAREAREKVKAAAGP